MIRTTLGVLLALAGAALAVWSAFHAWYHGRHGTDIRVDDLFTGTGVTPHDAAILGSLFLPFSFAALLTLLGVVLPSRLIVALGGLLVLGITTLWMVRQAQYSHSLTAGGDGLDTGVGLAVGGGALLLLSLPLLGPRRGGRLTAYAEPERVVLPPEPKAPPTPEPVPPRPETGPPAPDKTSDPPPGG